MADIRDILDIEVVPPSTEVTKDSVLDKMKKKVFINVKASKRPEGMNREVFALLYNDNKDVPPLFPTDTGTCYKPKAQLSIKRVRPWKWMPFQNPARTDGAEFKHWRREADEGKEYQFAKFNKKVPIPSYTDAEYSQCLTSDKWDRKETDHLLDLAGRFDLRFIIMHDRWDRTEFKDRSVEDIKDRYYSISGSLIKLREGKDAKVYTFDADHETRRKEQLKRLYSRTPEQIEEERYLLSELKKIELRKRDREKKQQDLQKLISAADTQAETRKTEKKIYRKRSLPNQMRPKIDPNALETAGIKFPDQKIVGAYMRSQRMKLPVSVGLKKTKAIEQQLQEIPLELNPIPTEEIVPAFNDLRSELLLAYELKMALASCEYEIETLRHQYEALNPGKTLVVTNMTNAHLPASMRTPEKMPADMIDVVGSPSNAIF